MPLNLRGAKRVRGEMCEHPSRLHLSDFKKSISSVKKETLSGHRRY